MDPNYHLSKNFLWKEFWCQGVEPPIQYYDNIAKVATELQKLRDAIGRPIKITSGWRSPEHNKAVGGAKNSQHLYGKAADIKVLFVHSREVPIWAGRYTKFQGFGVSYSTNSITHLDIRDIWAIWYYS